MSSHRSTSTNFSSLKKLLPPLPAVSNSQAGSDMHPLPAAEVSAEEHTAAVQQEAIHLEAEQRSNVRRSALSAKPGKTKPITRPSTFRLPIELQEALRDVANYNQLNMTDIVAEGIWLHLQNFSWPAESEQLRLTLASMF